MAPLSLGRKKGALTWSAPSLPAAEEQPDRAVPGAPSPGAQGGLQRGWRLCLDSAFRGGGLCTHRTPSGCGKSFNAFLLSQTQLIQSLGQHFPLPKQCNRRLRPDTKAGEQTGMSPICPGIPVSESPPRQSGERSPRGTTLAPRAWLPRE